MFRKLVCIAAVAVAWTGAPASASDDGVSREAEGRVKVDVAGRQRMLSQRMSAAACLAVSGIDEGDRYKVGSAAHDEFGRALAGLQNGDDALRLTYEPNDDVRQALARVEDIWRSFSPAVEGMIAGDLRSQILLTVLTLNMELLETSDAAVAQFQIAYSTNGSDPVMAKTINVAGRQRMLSQKMMKDACFLYNRFEAEFADTDLVETIALFEASLSQLEQGDPASGITAPPTQQVADQLAVVRALWTEYREGLAQVRAGKVTDPAEIAALAVQSDAILTAMHQAVAYYVDAPGA